MISAWDRTPADLRALGYARDPKHLFGRLHRIDTWNLEGDERGPVLGRAAKDLVDRALDLALPRIVEEIASGDGSTKLVLAMRDGGRVETVHMPRAVANPRVTVCLSSQIGCAMGCTFCATARMGLARHLTAAEIVGQLLVVLARLGPRGPSPGSRVNLVFMGMGEALHDVDVLERALDVLCDPSGLGIAPSRITVSTVGHVPGIDRLAKLTHRPRLAVSVNAASDAQRRSLMPVTRTWSLDAIKGALARWPREPHEKVTLEYVLLHGVNDDRASAERLAEWAASLIEEGARRYVLDLIPFNPWPGAPYREPSPETVREFGDRVRELAPRLLVTRRVSRGRDVQAACGNLATSA